MKEKITRSKHQTKYHLFLSGSSINLNITPSLIALWKKLKISKEITKSRRTKDRQHNSWKKKKEKTSLPFWPRFIFVSVSNQDLPFQGHMSCSVSLIKMRSDCSFCHGGKISALQHLGLWWYVLCECSY